MGLVARDNPREEGKKKKRNPGWKGRSKTMFTDSIISLWVQLCHCVCPPPLTRNYPQRKIKSYPPVPQNETFRGEQADTLVEETDTKHMHNVRSDKCAEKELNSIRGHDRHLLG